MNALKPERILARTWYCDLLKTPKFILDNLPVKISRKTLYNWINNYDDKDIDEWNIIRFERQKESEDIRKDFREAFKKCVKQVLDDPTDPMMHFAVVKYLPAMKYWKEALEVLNDIPDEEVEGKKPASKETINKLDAYLKGEEV